MLFCVDAWIPPAYPGIFILRVSNIYDDRDRDDIVQRQGEAEEKKEDDDKELRAIVNAAYAWWGYEIPAT